MKIKEPKNSNYCASVVEIKTLKPLENADRVQGAIIFGNQVIVSLETEIGDMGLYFPLETQLSHEYCHANNLYRHNNLNADKTKTGYFEDNRRIKCMKFRGNKSEGLFMPIASLKFVYPDINTPNLAGIGASDMVGVGQDFDELEGIPICTKYIPKYSKQPGQGSGKINRKAAKGYVSKLVENQFRFHQDTSMLYKNLHKIKPESLISITYKMHGTSGISSYIACKKTLSRRTKFARWLGVEIIDNKYDYIYSSRKVIKNEELLSPGAISYYKEDIWGLADAELREFIQQGMTLYYEIVGYLPGGGAIQKPFDYGYPKDNRTYGIYIYRITYTNLAGKVFEFSAKQVQDWCEFNGLNPVPQVFYGYARDLSDERMTEENWQEKFLETIKERYNEKDCYICTNKVPEEGVVIRIEGNDFEAYKAKSNRFYAFETKELDKGEINIEDEN